MGPLLLAGLATFGAVVAIGIVAAATPRPAVTGNAMPNSRRMAFVLFAFASGGGIWGVVAPLLAATNGSAGDRAGATLVPVLPILGAVVALALMMAAFSRLDPWILGRAAAVIVHQVLLTIVAAILVVVLPADPVAAGGAGAALPFTILGLVAAGAAIGLGIVGADGVRALAALDAAPPDDPDVRALTSRIFARCLVFEAGAIGAALVGIVLVVRAGA